MTYLKSFFVGMVAALIASTIYVCVVFVLPILLPFLLSRITSTGGSGAAGVAVSSGPVLVIAVVAFIAGFYWQLRRTR